MNCGYRVELEFCVGLFGLRLRIGCGALVTLSVVLSLLGGLHWFVVIWGFGVCLDLLGLCGLLCVCLIVIVLCLVSCDCVCFVGYFYFDCCYWCCEDVELLMIGCFGCD